MVNIIYTHTYIHARTKNRIDIIKMNWQPRYKEIKSQLKIVCLWNGKKRNFNAEIF